LRYNKTGVNDHNNSGFYLSGDGLCIGSSTNYSHFDLNKTILYNSSGSNKGAFVFNYKGVHLYS
jgi:hypothetical protein